MLWIVLPDRLVNVAYAREIVREGDRLYIDVDHRTVFLRYPNEEAAARAMQEIERTLDRHHVVAGVWEKPVEARSYSSRLGSYVRQVP